VNLLEIYAGKILAERMGDENKAVGNKMLWQANDCASRMYFLIFY